MKVLERELLNARRGIAKILIGLTQRESRIKKNIMD